MRLYRVILSKNSWIASVAGGAGGTFALYLFETVSFVALVAFPIGGIIAAAFYEWALRQRLSLGVGALIGLQAGIVMSVLVIIWTIAVTGVDHYEFAAAVTFMPVIICILSALGGWVAAFFLVKS